MKKIKERSFPSQPKGIKSLSGKNIRYLSGSMSGSGNWHRWSGDPGYCYSQQYEKRHFSISGEACTVLTRISWLEFLISKGNDICKDELNELKELLRKERIRQVFQ